MRADLVGFLLLLLTLDLVPMAVLMRPTVRRARRCGVHVGPYAGGAWFGGLIAGFLLNGLMVQYFLFGPRALEPVPFAWQQVMVLASGMFGSAVAVGGVYLYLR